MTSPSKNRFEDLGSGKNEGILKEVLRFMKHNKKYWLLPIMLVLLGFALLIVLGGSAAAPFIYTLF